MSVDLSWIKQSLQLRNVSQDAIKALDCMDIFQFSTGETILQQGQLGGGLFLLRSGRISIMMQREDEDVLLARDEEGALFAKHCLLDEHKLSDVQIVADDNCTVYKLSHASFIHLMRTHHQLAYAILFRMLDYQEETIRKNRTKLFPYLLALKLKAEKLPFIVKLIPLLFIVSYSSLFFYRLFNPK